MALDEPLENDSKFIEKDITFIIDKELLEKVSPVSIDYSSTLGFGRYTISSSLVAQPSCGGTCSC